MPLNAEQLAQLAEWFRAQFKLKQEVERIVEILLGDICAKPPPDLVKSLEKHGISKEQFDQMTVDEQVDTVCDTLKGETGTRHENLVAALDMIFEARYGWPEGTAEKMSIRDIFLALDHATGWDNPSKRNIWDITK
jgi:hypothetical protein